MSRANSYLAAPATDYVPVVKADFDLPNGVCRSILVGTAGTVNLMAENGEIRTGVPLVEGYNPIAAKQVRTGGTADNLVALY